MATVILYMQHMSTVVMFNESHISFFKSNDKFLLLRVYYRCFKQQVIIWQNSEIV